MDRYSFFIFNSFLSGYSVSAVGKLSDNLPVRGERYLAIGGDLTSNDQGSLYSDNVGAESAQNQDSEVDTESREEIRNQIGLKSPEDFDDQGNIVENDYFKPKMPEFITSGENSPEANEDRANNGWRFGIDPLMSRAINWASFPGTVRSGPNNGYYITGYFKAWNIAGTTQASMIANNIDMITMQSRKSFAALEWNETQLGAEIYRVDNRFAGVYTETGNIWASMDKREAALYGTTSNLNGRINSLWTETGNLWASMDKREAALYGTTAKIEGRINNLRTETGNLWASMDKREAAVYGTTAKIEGQVKGIRTELGDIWSSMDKREAAVYGTTAKIEGQVKGIRTELGDIWSSMDTRESAVYGSIDKKDKATNTRIDNLRLETGNLWTSLNKTNTDIADINKRLDSFSWSDVGIITALGLVKDSIDKFKSMFNVEELVGLNAHEGIFTRMIKSQFISLKNELNSIFKYEEDGSKGTYWTGLSKILRDDLGRFAKYLDTYFDINNKESSLYKIRYSIVSGFMDLEEILKLIRVDTLALRDSLNTVNLNLTAVNDWLKSIFEKPVGTVVATPFDYGRLEKMLKDLGFDGDGEGGWLKQIIKTVGGIIETAIKTLGDVLGKGIDGLVKIAQGILDLLDGLVDTILGLVIPKNWDFLDKGFGSLKGKFDVKFKLFLDLGGLVKNLFTPTSQDFLKAISFTWLGVNFDFTQSQSSLDIYVPKFRLAISVFIWAITAIYIYRKITGTGDVINDS